ncbi:MAG: hypothetical protein ACHQEB_00135 [Chitinophagales bacterium]
MRKNKKAIACMLVVVSVLIIAGCYKADTLYPNTDAQVNKAVSFANDIVPIFSQKCAISGCHGAGGHSPDLTVSKAYNSLKNGGYIDIADPKNSKLYMRLTGKITPAMPLTGSSNPSNINALVLTWITQKALNN